MEEVGGMSSDRVAPDTGTGGSGWVRTPGTIAPIRSGAVLLLLACAALVIGAIVVRNAYYGPGPGVADRIRDAHSPLVTKVIYRDPNPWEGQSGEVWVYLGHDTTQAEVNAFWCDVVVPAGGAEMYEKQHLTLWQVDQKAYEPGYFHPDSSCSR
jgi:hypothetical protein